MKRKTICSLLIGAVLIIGAALPVCAEPQTESGLSYDSYIYTNDLEPVRIPAPYSVRRTVSGRDLGVDGMSALSDVFYDGIDRLYLSDSSNNRLIITDREFQQPRILDGFDNHGVWDTFSAPTSCHADAARIYIADSANSRIVVLHRDTLELDRVLERPAIPQLGEDFTYTPTRVTVDHAGRLYVIASGINKGMLRLAADGTFTSFFGAPDVDYNVFELLWRKIATKEQRDRMQQYVPTEYSALLMDGKGFLYAVSQTSSTTPAARLNSAGDNVLTELWPLGDADYMQHAGIAGGTSFTDICLGDAQTYAILNAPEGRLYAYSDDGDLLYAFGGTGSQKGVFYTASAVEQMDGRLLVTDSTKGTITVFEPTEFGKTVQQAIRLYNAGDYDASYTEWQSIRRYCSNYMPAIAGMARIDMARGEPGRSMESLKAIRAHKLYGKAFVQARNDLIRRGFLPLCGAMLVLVVLVLVFKKRVAATRFCRQIVSSGTYRMQRFATYAMFHPFDAHWDIKHEKRGNLKTALSILAAFILCFAVRAQFSGYITTKTLSDEVNVPYRVLLILLPLAFWVVSNWCFTALMSGEGTMKNIVIATCYALKPYVVLSVPLLLLSHVLSAEETMLYNLLDTVCIVWVLALIFIGMMMIHDYTLGKSILTAILTLLGMCIIIFLLLLLVSLAQEIYTYFYGIYQELIFRTY